MPSLTITTTAAEAARLQAWAAASGAPDVKTLLVTIARQGLQQFEASQNQQTFTAGYSPITPT